MGAGWVSPPARWPVGIELVIFQAKGGIRMSLKGKLERIASLDVNTMEQARRRQDNLTKPVKSLGSLEELSIRVSGIKGEISSELGEKVVILCAADHGVVEEGVSAYPQEVTTQMLLNFAQGRAAITVLAGYVGAKVVLVDVGVKGDVGHPAIISQKVRRGTANFTKEPAMRLEEAEKAVEIGIELAEQEIKKGAGVIATGDMGIGNTTASSALIAALTGLPPRSVAGKGTGIDEEAFEQKVTVIEKALTLHRPSPDKPLDALAKVGGLEIGALAGVMIGGAINRVPVVIDGLISGAAALLAYRLCQPVKDYLLPSHLSPEPGHRLVLTELGLKPFVQLDMRLGEGSGAVLVLPIIEASLKILTEMATFEEAGVSQKNEQSVKI